MGFLKGNVGQLDRFACWAPEIVLTDLELTLLAERFPIRRNRQRRGSAMISSEPTEAARHNAGGAPPAPDAAIQPGPVQEFQRTVRRNSARSGRDTEKEPAVYCVEETLGYVIEGRARLEIDGQVLMLEPGDCLIIPKGARHRFQILEPLKMIESTMGLRTTLVRKACERRASRSS